jgi:uncharacterized membrane protein HdeD (DUF308 family)
VTIAHPPAADAAAITAERGNKEVHPMLSLVARDWWVYAVRGVAAIIFGTVALAWPGPTIAFLVFLVGAYAVVDGIAMLVALARGDVLARRHAWATCLTGVAGIVFAVATLFWPGITALTLLYLVAIWAISTGTLEIAAAIEFRREIDGEIWMVLSGALSITFGSLLVVFPGMGLLSLAWLFGFFAIMFGGSSLGLAYRLHGIDHDLKKVLTVEKRAGVA